MREDFSVLTRELKIEPEALSHGAARCDRLRCDRLRGAGLCDAGLCDARLRSVGNMSGGALL